MNSVVLRRTLRESRFSLFWWVVGFAGLFNLESSFFHSIQKSAGQFNQLLTNPAYKALIGEGVNYSTPVGFLTSQIFAITLPILVMIFCIGWGVRAIAGEEEAGTLELSLSTPISRQRFVAEKFASLLVAMGALALIFWLISWASTVVLGLSVNPLHLLAAMVTIGFLGISFGALALLVGAVTGSRGMTMAITGTLAVAAYFVNTLANLTESLKAVRLISPFYYYSHHLPLTNGFNAADLLVLALISVAIFILSVVAFSRRDLAH